MIKHSMGVWKIYSSDRGEHHYTMFLTGFSDRGEHNCNMSPHLRFRPLLHLPWTRYQHPTVRPFDLLISWVRDVPSEWVVAGSWRGHLHCMQWQIGHGGWVLQRGILGGRSCCFLCLGLKWEWLGSWVLQRDILGGRLCFVPCLCFNRNNISIFQGYAKLNAK